MLNFAINTMNDVVNDTITMAADVLKGDINAKKVMRLIDAGVTVYAVSEATGIAVNVLQDLVNSYANDE